MKTGLVERNNSAGTTYIGIFENDFTERSSSEKAGFEKTSKKDGSTIWVKKYGAIGGLLNNIEYDTYVSPDNKKFNSWKFFLDVDGKSVVLSMPATSVPSKRFIKLGENLDFSQPVLFKIWKSPDGKTAFAVYQNDANVPEKYSWRLGNLPAAKDKRDGTKDYSEQDDFLFGIMEDHIIPAVQEAAKARGFTPTTSSVMDVQAPTPTPVSDNDIPF